MARPHVKLAAEPYVKPEFPPSLEWWEIHRGSEHAGELLATFELLEVKSIYYILLKSTRKEYNSDHVLIVEKLIFRKHVIRILPYQTYQNQRK